MKVSIITAVYNNVNNIQRAINSVASQSYENIEHIVIDGGSTDGTVDVIKSSIKSVSVFVSEPDLGIYDALNKGVHLSSGDVVAILHSDDEFYGENVVAKMVECGKRNASDLVFSDMLIVDREASRIKRYYASQYFRRWMFRIGWMPPHPTCFISKYLFDEFGLYSLDYEIAGDFDLLVRFFYGKTISWTYCDQIAVKMNLGGVSNSGYRSKKKIFSEINQSLKANGVFSLPFFQFFRYLIRMSEIIRSFGRKYD